MSSTQATLRPQQPPPPVTTSEPVLAGGYEVRLARTAAEISSAQKLRYQLLYLERGGRPDAEKAEREADADEWDAGAHHIVVIDRSASAQSIVGTLRLVTHSSLQADQAFYTERAFDISALRARYPRLLELGRFCIAADKRQGTILLLIWRYAMQFIVDNGIELMFGCASFPGTDPELHRDLLGYLYTHNLAPAALRPTPRVESHVNLDRFASAEAGFEDATRKLPALLRGYLKLGARISDTAIIDPVFNTTFVCLYVESSKMLEHNTPLVQPKHRRQRS